MELVPRAGYDDDHATFRESVRRFVAEHVVGELDRWREVCRFDADVLVKAGEQGFLGTSVPEEYDGAGVDDARFPAVLVEELAGTGATGLALVVARQLGVVVPVLTKLAGDGEQEAGWLRGLASGELAGCVAVLTPDSRARAVPGAAAAGVLVLVDPTRPGQVAVVTRDVVEISVAPQLGGAEAAVADVVVDPDVLEASTVAIDGAGVAADIDLWTAIVSVGAAQAALDLAGTYVQERAVFGRSLSTFENTRFRLAEIGAELAAAQRLVDSALDALADSSLTPALAAAARVVAGRVHDQVVDQGMQLHGGYGYMREYPISHAFGDARFVRVTAAAGGEPREVLASALGI